MENAFSIKPFVRQCPVMVGTAQKRIVSGQKARVDAPGIDSNRDDFPAEVAARRAAVPIAPWLPESGEVPEEAPGQIHASILEAIDFFQMELLAVESSDHVSPAGRAMSIAKYAFSVIARLPLQW